MDNPTAVRYHALDALRAFALLLGIVFHAAESFCPERFSWAVVDRHPHIAFEIFQHASHSFRMGIFFLIAGFFGNLVLRRRGLAGFIRHRAQRILVPLMVGWVSLYPAMVLLWIWGKSSSGRLSDLGIPPQAQAFSVWELTAGFFVNLEFLGEHFSLTHLWFLYYLLLLYTCSLSVRALWQALPTSSLTKLLDASVGRLMQSRGTVPLLAAATLPLVFPMNGVDTPDQSLVPNVPVLLVYGLFFGLGWLIYRQPMVLSGFKGGWRGNLLLGLALVFPTYFPAEVFTRLGLPEEWSTGHYLAYNAMYALMMWAFVAGFIGLFLTHFPAENRFWRYVADSSYWLYLVHLLVVVPAQILVAGWDLPAALKYLSINLAAFPVLFLSYHYLARSTFIGQQLNGRRIPYTPFFIRRGQTSVKEKAG